MPEKRLSVNPVYTSVACNRTPEIADWNEDGVICFGASNAVALFDTNKRGEDLLTILSHHKSSVNSVKWLRKQNGSTTELVSCSADKTAAIWTLCDGVYKVSSCLVGHAEGITAITGVYLNDNDLMVYTTSIDSTIKIWERRDGTTSFKQTLNLNSGLCLTLHAHLLPAIQKPLLFCALDDHKVHVYGTVASCGGAGDVEEYTKLHSLVGHEDWVRGLDVMDVDDDTILLASCSQDTYIRLWRIQVYLPEADDTPGMKVERRLLSAYGRQYSVQLDAVLAGHEGWVYGIQWAPSSNVSNTNKKQPTYRLLSSSLDKTLIIWEPDEVSGTWVERVRVGEVGGNSLGFYGSRFGPRDQILGHGYNGSFHIWKRDASSNQWTPSQVCSGHFNEVEDVRWEPNLGRYIVSVSTDQTTRLHALWKLEDGKSEWHEIARPQVHGYDMASIAPVSGVTFASAAEEKVVRVFTAPHNFFDNFKRITGEVLADVSEGAAPEGASVPSLGLSNKAVFNDEDNTPADDYEGHFVPVTLNEPPTEETLMQNTLWPETHKLYGHGYEVFALDASPDGTILASACKATNAEHAAVILWETKTWKQIQKLVSHQLTVTQLAFSPDSQKLLSVSRDRRWTLYQRAEGGDSFEITACTDKTNGVHSRIIWCCAWARNGDVFGTGSRDGKVCLWHKTETPSQTSLANYALNGAPLEIKNNSITALAFSPLRLSGALVLAVGLESGVIRLYSYSEMWNLLTEMDNSAAHHLTVKRLTFNPRPGEKDVLLASCGADHLVRLYNVTYVDR